MSPKFEAAHSVQSCMQPTMSAFNTALSCVQSDIENGLLTMFNKVKGEIDAKNSEFQETINSFETRVVSQLYMNTPFGVHDVASRTVSAILGKDLADAQCDLLRTVVDNLSNVMTTYYHDNWYFRLTQAAKDYINTSLEDWAIRIPELAHKVPAEVENNSYDFDQMFKEFDWSTEPDTNMLSSFMNS
eukprot:jgi/Mesvir1/19824/Mv13114-RA.1